MTSSVEQVWNLPYLRRPIYDQSCGLEDRPGTRRAPERGCWL